MLGCGISTVGDEAGSLPGEWNNSWAEMGNNMRRDSSQFMMRWRDVETDIGMQLLRMRWDGTG